MPEDIFADLPPKARDLGPPVALYRSRPGLGLAVRLALIMVRLVLAAAVVGLGLRAYGNAAANPGALPFALLVLSLVAGWWCVVSAMRLAWRGLARGNVRGIAHCPGGLVCVLTDRVVVAPWDEIDWVWDGGLRFRTRGGAEVVLSESLEGVGTLAELVVRQTFQRLAICASAVVLGGGTAEFGPVKVTRTEIAVGSRRLAWPDVGRVAAGWPRMRVFRKGERRATLDVPLWEVPNPHALLALIERLREGGLGSIVIGPAASEPPPDDLC